MLLFHVRLKGWSTRQAMHTGISHEKNCKCAPILRRVKLTVSNTEKKSLSRHEREKERDKER